jgi:HEAT repeat protein
MSQTSLEAALSSGDDPVIVAQLRDIRRTRRLPAGVDLAQIAWDTRSPRIRNEAALTLLALDDRSAAKLIIKLLQRQDTKGVRGTLLYTLNEMKESVPLEILIEIIINDNYEAQEEAILLLPNSKSDEESRNEAAAKLKPLRQSKNKHVSLLAAEALDILMH